MKIDINGTKLEFDVFEASSAEKFQKETQKIIDAAEKNKGIKDFGKAIRLQCKSVFDFIDALFGEETHKKIFGESVNLRTCLEVYHKINNAILEDKKDIENMSAALKIAK